MNNDVITHPQIIKDSIFIKQLPLSELRQLKVKELEWLVLIPQRRGIEEIFELTLEDQLQLTKEISQVSQELKKFTMADKINVGALGNMVTQLHIHIIARYQDDPAWPGPVWGKLSINSDLTENELKKVPNFND